MNGKKFSIPERIRSFRFAAEGVYFFFRFEHNAWIHLAAAVCALLLCWFLKVSPLEWIAVLTSIGIVLLSEILNTAIEKIMDHLSPTIHPEVKVIKDLAAAAVLVAAIIAAIVGLIIFIPKII